MQATATDMCRLDSHSILLSSFTSQYHVHTRSIQGCLHKLSLHLKSRYPLPKKVHSDVPFCVKFSPQTPRRSEFFASFLRLSSLASLCCHTSHTWNYCPSRSEVEHPGLTRFNLRAHHGVLRRQSLSIRVHGRCKTSLPYFLF